jgi:gamma-glutamylcyclotransferase
MKRGEVGTRAATWDSRGRSRQGRLLVLAYGSNLDLEQMLARCPSARAAGRATLADYALVFGGYSHRWGGGVASLVRARGGSAEGVIFRVTRADVESLDSHEGVPFAYERVARWVVDECGRRRRVQLYLQPEESFGRGLPGQRYFAVLWRAYALWGLDRQALIMATMEATR